MGVVAAGREGEGAVLDDVTGAGAGATASGAGDGGGGTAGAGVRPHEMHPATRRTARGKNRERRTIGGASIPPFSLRSCSLTSASEWWHRRIMRRVLVALLASLLWLACGGD